MTVKENAIPSRSPASVDGRAICKNKSDIAPEGAAAAAILDNVKPAMLL